MDLSFPLPTADDATPVAALDLARVLAAPVAATERVRAAEWLAPVDGAFSAAMAARLAEWRRE